MPMLYHALFAQQTNVASPLAPSQSLRNTYLPFQSLTRIHLRMAAQCPRQQALWKIVKMCLTNPLFSAIMTTTMINAVMEMTSPLPVFRELPVGARRYWGSDSWLLSSPPKRSLSAVGRDGILPLQGLVFAVCMRPMLKVGAQFICRQWEWYRGSL